MELRPLHESDLPAVEAIYRANRSEAPPAAWQTRVGEALRHPDTVARVAMEAGEVAAYMVGEVRSWEFGSEPAGWIYALGVDPARRGKGLAQALVNHAAEAFTAMGVQSLRTMVRRDDVAVLRFFRSAGFAAGPYTELERALGDRR